MATTNAEVNSSSAADVEETPAAAPHVAEAEEKSADDGAGSEPQEEEKAEEEAEAPHSSKAVDDVVDDEDAASPTTPRVTVNPTKEDDSWIDKDKESQEEKAAATPSSQLRQRKGASPSSSSSSSKRSSRKAAAKVGAAASKRGQQLEMFLSKLSLLKPAVEFVQAQVVKQQVYIQIYIAVVLLLFGSYFVRSLKCFEVVMLLGASGTIGSQTAMKNELLQIVQKAREGAAYVATMHAARRFVATHAVTLFVVITCLVGVLASHIAGSVVIGLAIGGRLVALLQEFSLMVYYNKVNEAVKGVDLRPKPVLSGLAILLSLIAPASAVAIYASLMASKKLALLKVKLENMASIDGAAPTDDLALISVRFWTGILLAGGLAANFLFLVQFSWPFVVLSLPMVCVEHILCFFLG